MLRRLISTFVMVVLVAPAIAMCAGTAGAPANHDCCPKETVTSNAAAVPAPAMDESCCRMSDDAGQRVPTEAARIATAPLSSVVLPFWSGEVLSNTPAAQVVTVPQSSHHVHWHLLLTVLII